MRGLPLWLGLAWGLCACEAATSAAASTDAGRSILPVEQQVDANTDDDDGGDGHPDAAAPRLDAGAVGSPPLEPAEQDGLPVLQLITADEIDDEGYTPAALVYRGRPYTAVQAKYRGKTSLTYPKKSFTIKFHEGDLFNDREHGFADKRRIVLTSTFDDTSYVRQRLAYELWNLLQPQIHVGVYHAVVLLNGEYHGLYLVGDHVDDELVEASGLWSGGNLYKARTHDANLRLEDRDGAPKRRLDLGYTKEEGEPEEGEEGAFDDLRYLVTWTATADDDEFAEELPLRLARDEFEDWLLLVSVIDGRDSAGKNGYLYHDPRIEAPDPRWHYVPWDFNASFGQNWRTARISSQEPLEYYDGANALFERYARVPELQERIAQRYADALAGPWALERVLALLDAHLAEIDAAARRDQEKWTQAIHEYAWGPGDIPLLDYEQESAYVRSWIQERWAYVDANYP